MIVGMIQNRDTNLFRQLRNPNRREYIPLSGGSRTPTSTHALLGGLNVWKDWMDFKQPYPVAMCP